VKILCIFPKREKSRLPALAEACLFFSPQVALGEDAAFVEIGNSHHLFTVEECLSRMARVLENFQVEARLSIAEDVPSSLAFARYGVSRKEFLPIEALGDYLSPFVAHTFPAAEIFRKLGVETLGDFLKIPRRELSSRFGKDGLLAYERFLRAKELPWPRFVPTEKLFEKAEFDFAAQIENLEPVMFLLKTILHRVFLRLHARKEKIVAFDCAFHLNRFTGAEKRIFPVKLPLPQSDPKALLQFMRDRLEKELQKNPLEESVEAISIEVLETAPGLDTQRDFFSKAEEQKEAWSSLLARLREKLGESAAFQAVLQPRVRPEASWKKSPIAEEGIAVPAPIRPLQIFPKPLTIERKKEFLHGKGKKWRIQQFQGPERLEGEWWLDPFQRDYYRVETDSDCLWIFRNKDGLFLHGIFD
jgi:protein ImuB